MRDRYLLFHTDVPFGWMKSLYLSKVAFKKVCGILLSLIHAPYANKTVNAY